MHRFMGLPRDRRPSRFRGLAFQGLGSSVQEHALHAAAEIQAAIEGLREAARRGSGAKTEDECLEAVAKYMDAKMAGDFAYAHASETEASGNAPRVSLAAEKRSKAEAMRASLSIPDLENTLEEAGRAARAATDGCLDLMMRGQLRRRVVGEAETKVEERATVTVRRRTVDI